MTFRSVLLSFLLLSSSLCLAAPKPLIVGVTQEWDILHPYALKVHSSGLILQFLMKPTLFYNSKLKLEASLADVVPTYENKRAEKLKNGKLRVDFEINEKAKWGDGVDLTCEDFEYARQVSTHPNLSTIDQEYFQNLEKVEWDTKMPKKCQMLFRKTTYNYNQIGWYLPLSKHIDGKSFKNFADEPGAYEKNSAYLKDPSNPGLFYGPYVVEEYKLGSHVILKRNPYYFGTPAKIEKVIIKYIPSSTTLEAFLRSGEINYVAHPGFGLDQALNLDRKFKSENLPYRFHFEKDNFSEKLILNLKNPILVDQKVRQALAYALDKEQINQSFFQGKEEVASHFLPSFDPNFTSSESKIKIYKKNQSYAKKSLEEAGWKLNQDGFRYKNNQKLSLVFSTTSGNSSRETVQNYIVDQWKKIGVEVRVKNYPARVLFGEIARCNGQEGVLMAASGVSLGEVPRNTLHSKEIPTPDNKCSGINSSNFANAKMDKLLEKLDQELGANKRQALVHQILRVYTEELPEIPLLFHLKNYALSSDLTGDLEVGPEGLGFEKVETWAWKYNPANE